MDIKKYIASGILEQYVLGLVSEKDRKEIEQYMLQYPEIKREVDSIEKAMELYAEANKVKASEGLEDKILKEIENTPRELPAEIVSKPVSSWLPILLGVLLLGSAISTWYFYSQNKNAQEELNIERNNLQQLQDNCNDKDENIKQLNDQIEILINTGNKPFPLNTPTEGKPLASVFYNSETKKAYFNTGDLPVSPSNRKYELWALVNGVPTSMGQFDVNVNDTTILEVPFIENASIFAVTLEPLDNDPAPNLDELQVISTG